MNEAEIFEEPRVYLRAEFTRLGILVNAKGQLKGPNGEKTEFGMLFLDYRRNLKLENKKLPKNEKPYTKFEVYEFRTAFEIVVNEQRDAALKRIKESISCVNENLDPLHRFANAVCGADHQTSALVLAHFIWQVKRKLNGKKVLDHIMPILSGSQGGGKSTAINLIIKPVEEIYAPMRLNELADSRSNLLLERTYVGFCDELQHAEKADTNALKNVITAEILTTRLLHTNNHNHSHQNCTFIGATNGQVSDQIFDPSGMRRYFQINCQPEMDRALINGLDYLEIWKGVDEHNEKGYLHIVKEEVAQAQKAMTFKGPVEEFAEEFNFLSGSNRTKKIQATPFFNRFQIWCTKNGHSSGTSTAFGKKLTALGIEKRKLELGLFYFLPEDCSPGLDVSDD